MRHTPNLIRRSGIFYYRARVPSDLKDQYQRAEFWVSLKTSVRQEAELKLATLHTQKLQEYSEIRSGASCSQIQSLRSSVSSSLQKSQKLPKLDLDTLLKYWLSQSEKQPRTLMDANTALRRLNRVCEAHQAIKVDKFIAVAFKDALLAEGLAFATISKNMGLIKSIFEVALNNGRIDSNPFRDIKLLKPSRQEKSRLPFSPEDLKRIFDSPIYQMGVRPLGGGGEAAYWLPLIALMTGMRLEEIGQLRKEDIKKVGEIWYFDLVHDPENGKTLKNSSSCRRVPIHQQLIDFGLLSLINVTGLKSHDRLFPLLASSGSRQITASWSQWFGRYLRQEIGIADRRKTFHSFRHTFKDICREKGIPKEIHDRLTGHSSRDVSDGYGDAKYPIKPLSAAINSLSFDDYSFAFKRRKTALKFVVI